MSTLPTPEKCAEALVAVRSKVAGGPLFIELRELVQPSVFIGPYRNPNVVKEEAEKIRQFIAAVIRDARQAEA